MTHISKLPADVLSEIFLEVAVDGYHDVPLSSSFTVPVPSIKRPPSRVYGYIALSQVCREWRRVALGTPRLWCRMVFPCKAGPEELFARSGQAPMWVAAGLDSTPLPASEARLEFSLIKANSSRLRQLHLTGPALGIEDYLSTWTTGSPVDQLEDLALVASDNLIHTAPRHLRRLAVRNFPFSWDSSLLSRTLTTLAFCTYAGSAHSAGSAEELLNALGNMSGLEFLELSETVPRVLEGDTAAQHVIPAISLPRLRLLALKAGVKVQGLMDAIEELSMRIAWNPIIGVLIPAHFMGRMRICRWRSAVEPDSILPSDLEVTLSELKSSAPESSTWILTLGRSLGYDQLLDTLRYRRDHGVPITQLELYDCTNADRGFVKTLRKFVTRVVWDGHENFDDEEDYPEQSCEDRVPLYDGYDEEMAYALSEPNIFDGMSSEDAYAMIPWS
ncbi:hypothetical protein C8T65DRAFT_725925 [Cerioporus squamosus]|nr:hypothetical protein C8T65DRAFT_725925 [Cerioporus squamosus]